MNERKLTKTELDKREDIIMNMKKNKRSLVKQYGKDAEAVMYGRATNMAKKQTKEMKNPKLTELIKDALKNPKAADLNKDGKLSDYEEKRGAAIEKNIKEANISLSDLQDIGYDDGEYAFDKYFNKSILNNVPDTKAYKEGFLQAIIDSASSLRLEGKGLGPLPSEKKMYADLSPEEMRRVGIQYDYEDIGQFYLEGFGKEHTLTSSQLGRLGKRVADKFYGGDIGKAYDDVYKKSQNAAVNRLASKGQLINPTSLDEDFDIGHEDNEPGMLKAELYHIGMYAMELYKMMDGLEGMGEVDFPSWWQSKITTAKNNISGAKHYLEFELKEPTIDAVVDASIGVVDEEVYQLGTDSDTGFQASLYTPNEMGAAAVGKEYASGAFEGIAKKLAKQIKEGTPGDPERFVGSGGDEIDSDSNINVTTDNPAQDAGIGLGLEEGASKEDQLKIARAAFEKAEMNGDIRGQELALAAIDLINGNINEAMDGGQVFDYFDNKGYVVKERRPDGYPKKEGVVGYQVTDRPDSGRRSDNPQTVIFQHNPSTDQLTISQMNGYKIDQKDAVKAGMRQQGSSWVAGIDSYITDGNYNPVDISAEGLKDIVDHVMGGLSREAKAQSDFYKDRGPTSGTIDERISNAVRNIFSESFDSLSKKIDKQKGKSKKDAANIAGYIANIKRKGGGKGPTAKQKKRMSETEKDKKSLSKPVAKDLKKMKSNFNDLKKRLKLEDKKKKVDEGFKVGQKVTYLGHPAEITKADKDVMDRVYYNVSYDKGNGKTKASNIYNKDGEIKASK